MVGHGYYAYDPLVRVPFLIGSKDNFIWSGGESSIQIRQVDILPTLTDLCAIDLKTIKIDGRSLLPILQGQAFEEEPAFIEAGKVQGKLPRLGGVRWNGSKELRRNVNDLKIYLNAEH